MKLNYTKSSYSESWLEDGVVNQIISPKINKITIEIAKQLVKDRTQSMGDSNSYVLVYVVVNNAISVDKEAKKYYDTDEPYQNIRAIAMLMDNYIAKLVGNIAFSINKPKVPMSFFNSKDQAYRWLEQFRKLN